MIPTADRMLDHDFVTCIFPENMGFTRRLDEPYYASNLKIIGIGAEVNIANTSHTMYVYGHLPRKKPYEGEDKYTTEIFKNDLAYLTHSEGNIFFDIIRDSDMYKAFTQVEPEVELAVADVEELISGARAKKMTDQVVNDALSLAIKAIDHRINQAISTGSYEAHYVTTCAIVRILEAHYKERGFSVVCKPTQARLWFKWDEESLNRQKKEM